MASEDPNIQREVARELGRLTEAVQGLREEVRVLAPRVRRLELAWAVLAGATGAISLYGLDRLGAIQTARTVAETAAQVLPFVPPV